ncbi:MAG: O-antigen ligase family protein [Phycisphaeraceae bacterium]|nr:O-antigen ligase family protein [Phycisphaeraceae bacterium]
MIWIVFGLAFVLGVILFFVLPPRRGVIACLIGGWALLPTANFIMPVLDQTSPSPFTQAIETGIGSALIGPYWFTRSTVIGLTVLVGMLIADFKSVRRLRPKWFDLPMLIWCVVPLLSALRNQMSIEIALLNMSYHMVAWGVPYVAGRIYFSDLRPLRELGIALVIAGLCYVPLCMIEWVLGPVFYELFYAYHPYHFDGVERAIGYRPMVFLEHGSQLGIWMPAIALLAFWMHMSGSLPKLKVIPSHITVLVLILTAVICQSLGGVALMVLGMIAWALLKRGTKIPKPLIVGMAILIVGLGVFVTGGDKIVGKVIGSRRVEKLKSVSRLKSLGWRINAMQHALEPVNSQPFLGHGRWDWWELQKEDKRPVWSLFGQGLGEHGVFAALALLAIFVIPIWQFVLGCPTRLWTDINLGPPAALMVFLIMHMLDSFLNPTFSTSLICIAGGLNTIGPFLKRALKSA